jgi:phage tail tape-measure protein
VKCDNTGAIAGGLLGALAGGVLGSNVAGHGNKTGGTVLGGVLGGGLGAAVGHAHDKHQCDSTGAYWSYNDTVPYGADATASADPNAPAYVSRGCRLAPAQVSGSDYRYVRVCPDGTGKYRITG